MKLKLDERQSFYLCVAYIPPKIFKFEKSQIQKYLEDIIGKYTEDASNKEIFVVGDFNSRPFPPFSPFMPETSKKLYQLIEEPTYENAIYDHIYIKKKHTNRIDSSRVIRKLIIGDHRIIYVIKKIQTSYELQPDLIYSFESWFFKIESDSINPSIIESISLWSKTWFFKFISGSTLPYIIQNNGSFMIVFSVEKQRDVKIREILQLYKDFLKIEQTYWFGISSSKKQMTGWDIEWISENGMISIFKERKLLANLYSDGIKIDFNFDLEHLHAHFLSNPIESPGPEWLTDEFKALDINQGASGSR